MSNLAQIQSIAQSVRNLYLIAEKTNYPFSDVKYPQLKDILNIISLEYGFESYAELKKNLESNVDIELKNPPINYNQEILEIVSIKNSSSKAKEIAFHAINIYQELTRNPMSELDCEIISKLNCIKVNPLVSQIIDQIDYCDFGLNSTNFFTKKAVLSIALSQCIFISNVYNLDRKLLSFNDLIKSKNKRKNENIESEFIESIYEKIKKDSFDEKNNAINFHANKKGISFNVNVGNTNFSESSKKILLKSLLVNTMFSTEKLNNVEILKGVLKNQELLKDGFTIDSTSEMQKYEKVLFVINSILSDIKNIINYSSSKDEYNLPVLKKDNKPHIFINNTGLIDHAVLNDIYYIKREVNVIGHADNIFNYLNIDLRALSDQQTYWMIYLVVINICDHFNLSECSDYIDYCYSNSDLTAYTKEDIDTNYLIDAVKTISNFILKSYKFKI